MADGGALFCNYIITASLIGIALEFLRLGELFMYFMKRMFSRSRAEDNAIIKVGENILSRGKDWFLSACIVPGRAETQ